ncbi:hypothetical protein [Parapedobacter sp. 2B3]|uniref:hypothetical protein n=1 Tax=Parapedobacter sp. 2B3 TaxID=3342381 RepID=UPI0035B571B8
MLITGVTVGYTGLSTDDIGRGTSGFSVDQRGKLVLLKSETWPDQIGLEEVRETLTAFLAEKGNGITHVGTNRMESVGSIRMKNHAGIGNHVAGDVHYTLVIEDNGSGFTYWFTDLTYQPYRNDRYGKLVKATVSPIPLENRASKINAHIWQKQKTHAYEAIDGLADQLLAQLEAAGRPGVVNTGM